MRVLEIVLAAYFLLAIVLTPFTIGKPRKPVDATVACITIVLCLLTITALWVR